MGQNNNNSFPLKSKSTRNPTAGRMMKMKRTLMKKCYPLMVVNHPKASRFQRISAAIKVVYLKHYNQIQLKKKVRFNLI